MLNCVCAQTLNDDFTQHDNVGVSDHRLCDIQTGDVVCDPMAGGGIIPIEVEYRTKPTVHTPQL